MYIRVPIPTAASVLGGILRLILMYFIRVPTMANTSVLGGSNYILSDYVSCVLFVFLPEPLPVFWVGVIIFCPIMCLVFYSCSYHRHGQCFGWE